MADNMHSPKHFGHSISRDKSVTKNECINPYILFVRAETFGATQTYRLAANINRPGLDLGNCSHNLAFRNETDTEIECIEFSSNVIYNRLSKQLRVRNDNSSLVDGDVDIGAPKSKLLEKYCYTSVSPKCTGLVYTT